MLSHSHYAKANRYHATKPLENITLLMFYAFTLTLCKSKHVSCNKKPLEDITLLVFYAFTLTLCKSKQVSCNKTTRGYHTISVLCFHTSHYAKTNRYHATKPLENITLLVYYAFTLTLCKKQTCIMQQNH